MRIILTGGTGLIGRALAANLVADGHETIVLTRNPSASTRLPSAVKLVNWDAATATGWGEFVDGADAIVNLAGEGIADGRWSEKRKERIYASRVNAGAAVMQAIEAAERKPKVLIQSSAVGYYGPSTDRILTEDAAPGADFLSQVCFDWEASTAGAERYGVRRVVIRTGIVLSNDGGAWPKIVLPFRLFAGGQIGSGRQYWPWIHLDDEVAAIRFLIENPETSGVFNLSAPTPLANREFASKLGAVMGRPAFLPAPAFALQLVFGEMSTVLLDGQRAVPQRLEQAGFRFRYPEAEAAFRALL
jgi:uncharacterized protein